MPLACMGCFHRPSSARWTGGAIEEEEVSRGVSRKARRHIIKIRMPQSPARAPASESVATEEIITPNREGRPDTRTGLVSSPPEDRMAPTSQQPEPGAASDADAVVAVKVRKSGVFGMFRKPVGGTDDVVLVPAGETCVICMEPFKPSEVLQVLLCQHLYHDSCIDRWLEDHTSCCVCKADMEEMARAARKPSRRRSSRGTARSETRSERSADDRSESGYGSDQARSTWSSLSAPAALVDRVPPDVHLAGCERQSVSVLPSRTHRPRSVTHSPPPCEPSRESDQPPSLCPRSPYFNPGSALRSARCSPGIDARSPGRNPRSPRAWPILPSPRINRSLPPEWDLRARDSEERNWITSSSSSAISTDDDCDSTRVAQNCNFETEEMFEAHLAFDTTSPGSGYGSRTLVRSSSVVWSPAPSPVRALRSISQDAPTRGQVLPRLFPSPSCFDGREISSPRFPPKVASLSTPQRRRSHPTAPAAQVGLEPPSLMPQSSTPGYESPWRESRSTSMPGRRASRLWTSPGRGRVSSRFECARSDHGERRETGMTEEEKEECWGEEREVESVAGAKVPGNGMAWARAWADATSKQEKRSSSHSHLPRGKLNGWANDKHDEQWMEEFGKSPTSEPGSDCITCSTQWSEMGSQVSGGSGSVNSCAGEASGGVPLRRRSRGVESVSPGDMKQGEHLWAGGNGVNPSPGGSHMLERSLCHRSLSAPVIWDDE